MLALMIPIAAIVLGIGAGMLAIWVDYRKKREFFQLHHAERMAAIEKGIEVPPLPPEFFANYRKQRTPEDALRHGLLWLFVGIAVTVALFSIHTDDFPWEWGLVPTAAGIATLLYYAISRRAARESAVTGPGAPSANS